MTTLNNLRSAIPIISAPFPMAISFIFCVDSRVFILSAMSYTMKIIFNRIFSHMTKLMDQFFICLFVFHSL